jgi:sialate O-acetylesterase
MNKLLLMALLGVVPLTTQAQLRVSRLIGDGMVMQRHHPVPVWGWASPGTEVTVTFDQQPYRTRADASGGWRVQLPAMAAGGPHTMTIEGAGTHQTVQDILVGDVWVCSGQSNMEWTVANARDAAQEIAAARDRHIRHFKVPLSWANAPEPDLAGGTWAAADPAQVGDFTAVGYYFARHLRAYVDVPIGLINTSWGGSRIEPWMSAAMLGMDEAGVARLLEQEESRVQRLRANLQARIGSLPTRDAGLVDGQAHWADPSLDDTGWASIDVRATWEQAGYEGMDGIAWYRTAFDLTAEEARAGLRLSLGTIDDSDVTWINGQEVGRMEQAWNQPRVYTVPPTVLRPGRNVLAVRVEDTGGGGGMFGDPGLLYLEANGQRRTLAGMWRFRVGVVTTTAAAQKNQVAMLLYNKMIYPLLPYPIKGALWYQGESNAGDRDAFVYRDQFRQMITGWRQDWGVGDFPFLYVQLANFMAPDSLPAESGWAMLRESQSAALTLPHTAQAVIIDLGEAEDIHPRNKQDVGLRLSLAARKVAYGEDLVWSGPVYRHHTVRTGQMVLTFDHVGSGLVAKGGMVQGFAIAGADRRFVWAQARLEGNTVVVWHEAIPDPQAVRYAWGNNPDKASLYNREGLPASPFRTDTW